MTTWRCICSDSLVWIGLEFWLFHPLPGSADGKSAELAEELGKTVEHPVHIDSLSTQCNYPNRCPTLYKAHPLIGVSLIPAESLHRESHGVPPHLRRGLRPQDQPDPLPREARRPRRRRSLEPSARRGRVRRPLPQQRPRRSRDGRRDCGQHPQDPGNLWRQREAHIWDLSRPPGTECSDDIAITYSILWKNGLHTKSIYLTTIFSYKLKP